MAEEFKCVYMYVISVLTEVHAKNPGRLCHIPLPKHCTVQTDSFGSL